MPSTKIAFVVLYLGAQRMEVVMETHDAEGERRRRAIDLAWLTKDPTDLPPTDWLPQVQIEMNHHDSDRTPYIR